MKKALFLAVVCAGSAIAGVTSSVQPTPIRFDVRLLQAHLQTLTNQLRDLHLPALQSSLQELSNFETLVGAYGDVARLQKGITSPQGQDQMALQDQYDMAIEGLLIAIELLADGGEKVIQPLHEFTQGFQLLTTQLLQRLGSLKNQQEANELMQAMAYVQQIFLPTPSTVPAKDRDLWRRSALRKAWQLLWQDSDTSVHHHHIGPLLSYIPKAHAQIEEIKRTGKLNGEPTKN